MCNGTVPLGLIERIMFIYQLSNTSFSSTVRSSDIVSFIMSFIIPIFGLMNSKVNMNLQIRSQYVCIHSESVFLIKHVRIVSVYDLYFDQFYAALSEEI